MEYLSLRTDVIVWVAQPEEMVGKPRHGIINTLLISVVEITNCKDQNPRCIFKEKIASYKIFARVKNLVSSTKILGYNPIT